MADGRRHDFSPGITQMTNPHSIEQRLTALEQEVARLKVRMGLVMPTTDWIEAISGSMKHFPEFEEVIALGREFRESGDLSGF
jgi:hypothetical protein